MPRYFEYKDDKSSKFWEIDLHGNSYTVRFGKIGTAGQTQVKEFANEAAAKKEYDKLIEEKTKKGYDELAGGDSLSGTSSAANNVVQLPVRNVAAQKTSANWQQDDDQEDEDDDDDDDDEVGARKSAPGKAGAPKSGTARSAGKPIAGARRFEFEDDKSSKFWEISLDGPSFTVRYGRMGTDGQEQTKDFASEAQAEKEYEKLVQEKLKKGYEEVDAEECEADEGDEGDEGDEAVIDFEGDGGEVFAGLPIEEWDADSGIEDASGCAYKIALSYEEDHGESMKWGDKLSAFLEDPESSKVKALVVGSWGAQSMCEGVTSAEVVEALVAARKQLPNLKAIYVGDAEAEECEISWIQQSDLSPLFAAYPKLTHFRVRGGEQLELGTLKHQSLQSLVIESGGLPAGVVRSIAAADFPELVHLELWMGTPNYGGDATVEDLGPILAGKVFPKLRYLGLRNSVISDDIAKALIGAPILKRIKVLDFSMGTLGDDGAEALAQNPDLSRLERIDVSHHYMSAPTVQRLSALGNIVGLEVVSDYIDEVEEGEERYCEVSE